MLYKFLKPNKKSRSKKKRVGRGNASGWGGECGRGHKGQKSRSGFKSRPGFEGGQTPLYRRIPKKPGMGSRFKTYYQPINLEQLNRVYEDNEIVDSDTLYDKGLIAKGQPYKILGKGELTKSLTIMPCPCSASVLLIIQKSQANLKELAQVK